MTARCIYLLVPTRTVSSPDPKRNKLASLKRLVRSIEETTTRGNVVLCLGIDRRPEDAPLYDYARTLTQDPPFPIQIRHETDTCSGHWKTLSLGCPTNGDDVVMLCADDIWFPDAGWDAKVLEHTKEADHRLYFCDDGFGWRDTFATHPFLRFDTVKTIGGLATGLWSRANDTWLWCMWHLFDKGRIVYMTDVRVVHAYVGENEHQVRGHKADMAKFREVGSREMTWRVDRLRTQSLNVPPPPESFTRDYMRFRTVGGRGAGSHDIGGKGYEFEIEILGN